jgi:hypothetical protein
MRAIGVVLAVAASGCIAGGGTVVGYERNHGFIGGAEGNAGFPFLQLAAGLGVDTAGFTYQGRFDFQANSERGTGTDVTGRLGIGFLSSEDATRPMYVMGAGAQWIVGDRSCSKSNIIELAIELRYVRDWQIAFAQRYFVLDGVCFH